METQCQDLTVTQRTEFLTLLQGFGKLFDVKLGPWITDPVDFELKEAVKPICLRPYPVPKVHKEIFRKEVECLVVLGFLEVANDSEWGARFFAQMKPKSNH